MSRKLFTTHISTHTHTHTHMEPGEIGYVQV